MSDKELTDAPKGASRAERIRAALNASFSPETLEIVDDSHRHSGHAGARPEGETHFTVRIRAAAFAGQTRVARNRAVMAALKPEFDTGLHALSLEVKAPGEA